MSQKISANQKSNQKNIYLVCCLIAMAHENGADCRAFKNLASFSCLD